MALDATKREQIRQIFQTFLEERVRTIRRLEIDDLHINPFLIRLLARELELNDARAIVNWLVWQRAFTGANTSFGFRLQDIATLFSEGTGAEGADILKTREGRRHYIQVKSGPSTMDKDAVARISELLLSVQRRNRGSVALIGMCYGTREQVMSTVKKYSEVEWLIGREFWEFISDDPECVEEIYRIAGEVSETFRDSQGETLAEVLRTKVEELTREFHSRYGWSGEEMWQRLLERNV